MTAYFISGLGADERVFENLRIKEGITLRYIHWIEPLKKESLKEYIDRLMIQVDTSDQFILIGMSLGGIIAVEMNKICQPLRTIIISSVCTTKEFSFLFRLIHFFQLQKITPAFLFKTPTPLAYWFFGIKSKAEKILLRSFMKNVTSSYLRWSVNQVLNWKNSFRPAALVHIHGTNDKIFPYRATNATILIKNGGHFMVHNKADEISSILNNYL